MIFSGQSFDALITTDPLGQPEAWFKLTVAAQLICDIQIGLIGCVGLPQQGMAMTVYEDSCTGPVVASESENCSDAFAPGDLGARVSFTQPDEPTAKTYYIKITATSGLLIEPEIVVQGRLIASNCRGDPHFTRWNQPVRDTFHGECDLVLYHNEEIEGQDLDVHVRTTIKDSFSYVEGVAVKFGDDVVEFEHDALFVNGVKVEDESLIAFANNDNKIVKVDEKKRQFNFNIANMVTVSVHSTKHFMGVSVQGAQQAMTGSTGILGDYNTGDMIGRHGNTFESFEDFAFEWQVHPSDPAIFMHAREPQLPYERCRMPSMSAESRRRKLRGQDRKLYEQALTACSQNHIPENVQSCLDDVMFTGELDLAYDI